MIQVLVCCERDHVTWRVNMRLTCGVQWLMGAEVLHYYADPAPL